MTQAFVGSTKLIRIGGSTVSIDDIVAAQKANCSYYYGYSTTGDDEIDYTREILVTKVDGDAPIVKISLELEVPGIPAPAPMILPGEEVPTPSDPESTILTFEEYCSADQIWILADKSEKAAKDLVTGDTLSSMLLSGESAPVAVSWQIAVTDVEAQAELQDLYIVSTRTHTSIALSSGAFVKTPTGV